MITSQELAFVRLAMRQRILSVNVVQEAVERKKWDAPDRPLTEILVDMGALGPEQAQKLRKALDEGQKDGPKLRATQIAKDPNVREEGIAPGVPQQIGPYQLVRLLGAGAMGAVYHARHGELQRDVALKLLQSDGAPSPRAIQRFKREARLAARLDHPNIVRVYEAGFEDNQHFIAMDMVRGRSVSELLTLGEITVRRAVHVMRKTAEAVAYAHEQGVIHRDLKPANILVDDKTGEPRVTDFGLATLSEPDADDKLTRTGAAVGTPAYMAPEQVRGHLDKIDRRTDVYALGATLYEMLTGGPPFDAPTFLELAKRICEEDPVSPRKKNPTVSAAVETVCLKALEKDPLARYQTATDMAADLAAFLDDAPIRAQPPGPIERARKWARRRPAFVAGSLGFVAVLGAALGFWLSLPGTIELSTQPAGAVVVLDGTEIADEVGQVLLTPDDGGVLRLQVPAGVHDLRFRLDGYLERAIGVDVLRVGHGETLKLTGTLVSTKGLLRVDTTPTGAPVEVFAKDELRAKGVTPYLCSLEAGEYRVVLGAASGHLPPSPAMVEVSPGGAEVIVRRTLERDQAELRIDADPENVTVRWARDGSSRVAPAVLRGSGVHELEVTKAGYLPQRLTVTVPPGGSVDRFVTLAPLAAWRRPLEGRLLSGPLVRDVDGDGAPDLVVIEEAREGARVALLLGAGHTGALYRVDTAATTLIDAEDVDGDGVLDLLLGSEKHVELRDGLTGRLVAQLAGAHGPTALMHRAPGKPAHLLLLDADAPRLVPASLAGAAPGRLVTELRAPPALVPRGVRLGGFSPKSLAVFPAAGAVLVWDVEGGAAPQRVALPGVTPTSAVLAVAVDRQSDPWVVVVPEEGQAWLLNPQDNARFPVGDATARFRRPAFLLHDRPWLLLTDDARTRAFVLSPAGAREPTGASISAGAVVLRTGTEPSVAAAGLGPAIFTLAGDLFVPQGDAWARVDACSTDSEPWASREQDPVVADADGDGLPEVLLPAPDRRAVVALDPTPDGRARWRVRQPLPDAIATAALEGPLPAARDDLVLGMGERLVGRASDDGRVLFDDELKARVLAVSASRPGPTDAAGLVYVVAQPEGTTAASARTVARRRRRDDGRWFAEWTVTRPAIGVEALTLDVDGDKLPDLLCGGPLAVLKATDGAQVWGEHGDPLPVSVAGPRLLGGGAPLCVGAKAGDRGVELLVAHDPLGKLVWQVPLGLGDEGGRPDPARLLLGEEGEAVMIVVTATRVLGLRRTDGTLAWAEPLAMADVVGAVLVAGAPPKLVLTRRSGELLCFDASNGTPLWARRLPQDRANAEPSPPVWLPAPRSPRPLAPGDPKPEPLIAVVAPTGVVLLLAVEDGAVLGERRSSGAPYLPWLHGVPAQPGLIAATEDQRLVALSIGREQRTRAGRRERVREQLRRIDLGGPHVRTALAELQALVREDPADASAQVALARAHLDLGDHAQAFEAARAAARSRGRLPEALRIQAEAMFARQGSLQDAEPFLLELMKVDPPLAAEVAARFAMRGGQGATRFLRRVREAAPLDSNVRRLLGLERLRSIPTRSLALEWNERAEELADARRVATEARAELLLSLTRKDDDETRAAAIVALVLERRATVFFSTKRRSSADAERLSLVGTLLGGVAARDPARPTSSRVLELAFTLARSTDGEDVDPMSLQPTLAELGALRPEWAGALQGIGALDP